MGVLGFDLRPPWSNRVERVRPIRLLKRGLGFRRLDAGFVGLGTMALSESMEATIGLFGMSFR